MVKRKTPEPGPGPAESRMAKTNAKTTYCLSEKDLEALTPKEAPNPIRPRGPTQKLYLDSELEDLAVKKWGSPEAFQKERDARAEKRAVRASQPRKQGRRAESEQGDSDKSDNDVSEDEGTAHSDGSESASIGLDKFVEERTRRCRPDPANAAAKGKYVLYWMRTAVRGHENPALDAARLRASAEGVSLVVVAFVLASHSHPTARRFKFWLEGLQQAQAELRGQGLDLWIFLEGHTSLKGEGSGVFAPTAWGELMRLVNQSSLVVTEDMPTTPYARWLQDIVDEADAHVRVWAVDTACVVPMRLTGKAHARAYTYRSSSQKPLQERLQGMPYRDSATNWSAIMKQDWQAVAAKAGQPAELPDAKAAVGPLEWEPLDLCAEGLDIPRLVAGCRGVDQGVPGIQHQLGGCSHGYGRWARFKADGLSRYASRRNNAMIRDGVSRLSAYHHYGMVSPFKIARDLHNSPSSGARRMADEFHTWRNVAHVYCLYTWPKIDTLEGLPGWSRATLERHKGDNRKVYTRAQLEKGETDDAFWNAAQQQLADTGELHNNVRMSWGKALLAWTRDPAAALEETLHLNHRFALDGCDPCSHGGVGWCFGLFDGPKNPEATAVYGCLRTRPTSVMARRFNAESYRTLPVEGPSSRGGGGTVHVQAPAPGQRTLADCVQRSQPNSSKQVSPKAAGAAGKQAQGPGQGHEDSTGQPATPGPSNGQAKGQTRVSNAGQSNAGHSPKRGSSTQNKSRTQSAKGSASGQSKNQLGITRFLKPVSSPSRS
ncbi:hypothetical protein WJX73_008373 [Symbiochloris irregularis]|uniref:Photolyase/cryptochrome alpha/beta domain-containing protein n=1 Tax=Symbiochloris irregularis TaxID=706552 RepID=A0AAW1P9W1_9CHLO